MRLIVNGEPRDLAEGSTVSALLDALALDHRRLAVERNLEIVPKSTWAGTQLDDGDVVEIVQFVGGG